MATTAIRPVTLVLDYPKITWAGEREIFVKQEVAAGGGSIRVLEGRR